MVVHEPSEEACKKICGMTVRSVGKYFRQVLDDAYVRHPVKQLAREVVPTA